MPQPDTTLATGLGTPNGLGLHQEHRMLDCADRRPRPYRSKFSYPTTQTVSISTVGGEVTLGRMRIRLTARMGASATSPGSETRSSIPIPFTGPIPTFHAALFDFPIQLFMDGGPLPVPATLVPSHIYNFTTTGNGGPFVFNYSDIPGDYPDNSGTFSVCISDL